MHVFNWRADGLDYKVDMHYEDSNTRQLYLMSKTSSVKSSAFLSIFNM